MAALRWEQSPPLPASYPSSSCPGPCGERPASIARPCQVSSYWTRSQFERREPGLVTPIQSAPETAHYFDEGGESAESRDNGAAPTIRQQHFELLRWQGLAEQETLVRMAAEAGEAIPLLLCFHALG